MNPARGVIDGLGFGETYHSLWWRIAARRRRVLTDWSRRHNALFIHVPKAAGLSVYHALGMEQPPDTHAPAAAYRAADPDFFDGAFRFTVVRNPWDRLVSAYHYLSQQSAFPQDRVWARRRLARAPDFASFMGLMRHPWTRNQIMGWRHFLPQTTFLEVRGQNAMNLLIPFEELEEGLTHVAALIGAKARLAHRNSSRRGDYRQYYTDEDAALVARLYAADVAMTGARFEDGGRRGGS